MTLVRSQAANPGQQNVRASTLAGSVEGLDELRKLTDIALEALSLEASRRQGPLPAGGPAAFRRAAEELPESFLPETGADAAAVVGSLAAISARWSVDLARPGALARMQCPPTVLAVAAELIAATLNQGLQAWESGPFAGIIEQQLLRDVAELVGYPAGAGGAVTSGGSASNMMALLLARDHAIRRHAGIDVSAHGLAGTQLDPKILCSQAAHVSVKQAVRLLGIGSDAIVAVETDRLGRLVPAALRAALARLGSHTLPVAVVATAGTTDFGAFDPLEELSAISREHAVWLHVDAAYGAGVLFSRRLVHLAAGIGLADSITLDFHKFGWTPAAAGILLVCRPELLEPLTQRATYLSSDDDEALGFVATGGASIQTTRRFDALKIAASLLGLGRAGLEVLVDRCHELALYAAQSIAENPRLELAAEPILSTVVFRCVPATSSAPGDVDALNAAVRRRLLERGRVLVGRTVAGDAAGRRAVHLKLVLLSADTTRGELDAAIEEISATASEVDACA